MKKTVLTLFSCLCLMLMINTQSNAQNSLIYYWNFNNFTTAVHLPAIVSLAADYSITGLDTAKARITYTPMPPGVSASYSTYADNVTGDTTNARNGAPAGNGLRTRNPSDSMELLFFMPTTKYKNLQLKYACQTSSFTSGMLQQIYSYSLDSGATWKTSGNGLSMWNDTTTLAYSLYSIHISDTNAYNNKKFVFRITFNFNTTGTSGNNRFDNVTLEGDTITNNSQTGINDNQFVNNTCTLSPNPVNNQLHVSTDLVGEKTVIIINAVGQKVYESKYQSQCFIINTNDLKSGIYFMNILSNTDPKSNIIKQAFIKQ